MTMPKKTSDIFNEQCSPSLAKKQAPLGAQGTDVQGIDNDMLNRQAREIIDRLGLSEGWDAVGKPAMFSAFKIFQQLADQNYGKAYYLLSLLFLKSRNIEGSQDLAKQYAQMAFDWCFANQSKQDAELWFDLSDMYCDGLGVEQNDELALFWLLKAAKHGNAVAQRALGSMYHRGLGIEKNDGQAVYWFRKAAEQGDIHGQKYLGTMYKNGYGIEQNDVQAVYWFHKAASQDDAFGQYFLGYMYHQGRGIEKDNEQAVYWFHKAAEQGDDYGQTYLGDMYLKGCGVEQNSELAIYWYRKAAEQGNVRAKDALRLLGVDWKK